MFSDVFDAEIVGQERRLHHDYRRRERHKHAQRGVPGRGLQAGVTLRRAECADDGCVNRGGEREQHARGTGLG